MTPSVRAAAIAYKLRLKPRQAQIIAAMLDDGDFMSWRQLKALGLVRSPKALMVQTHLIRKRIGQGYIETDKGRGYRLTEAGRELCAKAFGLAIDDLSDARPDHERDLWIDGALYRVPAKVWAHVRFLGSVISNLSENCGRLAARARLEDAA